MKNPGKLILLCICLSSKLSQAQIQWYQHQNAQQPQSSGTIATCIRAFTPGTFIASYLWSNDGDTYTWKISKSGTNGSELKTFFISGIASSIEFRVSKNNYIYILERAYTPEFMPRNKLYKLNTQLQLVAQQEILFANNFSAYSVNAFEIDDAGNVYLAGDGMFSDNYMPASFLYKSTKNLVTSWQRLDSIETSYTRLHIGHQGKIHVIEDYYTLFPSIRMKRFNSNGQLLNAISINTDSARINVNTALDDDDNLLLWGVRWTQSSQLTQSLYVRKISRTAGQLLYSKTYLTAPSVQLNDLRIDHNGNGYVLAEQQDMNGNTRSVIVRMKMGNGVIMWTRNINYNQDSCHLYKIIMDDNDRFYAIGARETRNAFTKGYAMRITKSGNIINHYIAPDSTSLQRSNWLEDAMIDDNGRLIAVGSTRTIDTTTQQESNLHSFAVRIGVTPPWECSPGNGNELTASTETPVTTIATDDGISLNRVAIYPNPVQDILTVQGMRYDQYDRLMVLNMQGAIVKQQQFSGNTARVDVSALTDGVYVVLLRSSTTLKEQSIKFIIKRF